MPKVKVKVEYGQEMAQSERNSHSKKRGWETTDRIKEINLSRLMGKPTICIGENKGADQLRGNREADQRLCFRYSDSTIPPLLNSKISSF